MAPTPKSKRFMPNMVTERIVPVILVLLLLILLAVFVVIGLSVAAVFPAR